tara:strand:- start:431 stop:1327 length:897 start_codon:yes stop_codon:yes gene_type:complete
MFKFLTKYFLFFLSINLFVLLLFIIKFNIISESKSFIYKGDKVSFSEIDIAVFGHSQSQAGIDENIISKKLNLNTFNFSKTGIPLYYSTKKIEFFLKRNDNIKIILELGTNNIGKFGSLKELLSKKNSRRVKFLSENIFFLSYDELLFFATDSPVDFYLSIYRSILKNPLNFEGSLNHKPNLNNVSKRENQVKNLVQEKWEWESVDFNFEKDKLKQLIADKKNVTFKIVRLPEIEIYVKWHNNSEEYNLYVNELLKYKNVTFNDFIDQISNPKYFRDYNHLSQNGKELFTLNFINYLQ